MPSRFGADLRSMNAIDWDDPVNADRWCAEQREKVAVYLETMGVAHGRIGCDPAWMVAPYVAIWAIESARRREHVGWWVLSGDMPTDSVSATGHRHPRLALAAMATRWRSYVAAVRAGSPPEGYAISSVEGDPGLLDMIERRADTLGQWAAEDDLWDD